MSIFVTGVKGQLGYDIVKRFKLLGLDDVVGLDKEQLDITNINAIDLYFKDKKLDAIIHCAAYTAVDLAEDQADTCMQVNVQGTENLLHIANIHQAKFMFISTDYVFDGEKNGAYLVNDIPNPQSVYGRSKLLGEELIKNYENHFIVRISWVFGINGNNFVKTMLRLGKERESLNIVNDQMGSPTYTPDLAILIYNMIQTEKYGIYHATNEGTCSWYEFANEIFSLSKYNVKTQGISTDMYPTKAKRPKNSVLDKSSLDMNGFHRLPHWKDALKRYIQELGEQ